MLGRAKANAKNRITAERSRQQQPVPQPHLPAVRVFASLDEPQRREFQVLRLLPHEQMQQDRHRNRQRPAQECHMHERHQYLARRLTRYSVSA